MKNFVLAFLFLSSIIVSCTVGDSDEAKSIFVECPRTNIESNASVTHIAEDLANELTSVTNCGRAFHMPICKEGSAFEDQATVVVEEWCSPFNACICNNFPNGFTIADQDALIAHAKSLLEAELTTCGIERANYSFESETLPPINPCDGFRIRLSATAIAFCCAAVE